MKCIPVPSEIEAKLKAAAELYKLRYDEYWVIRNSPCTCTNKMCTRCTGLMDAFDRLTDSVRINLWR